MFERCGRMCRSLKFCQRSQEIQEKLALQPPPNYTKTSLHDHLGILINNCGLSKGLRGQQGQTFKKTLPHTQITTVQQYVDLAKKHVFFFRY